MFKHIVIISSILGILYIPMRMLATAYSLEELTGTMKEIHRSATRTPYYTFTLKEYSCRFYNKGNGTLSRLKDAPKVDDKPVSLMIKSSDKPLLKSNQELFYFGLNKKDQWIDLYYSIVRPGLLIHFITLFLYFFILLLNVIIAYRYPRQEPFVHFIKLYLVLIFLLMFL